MIRSARAGSRSRPSAAARSCSLGFAALGIAGEPANCLALCLAAVSRKLERPLAVVIQSSSAADKSALLDAAQALVPFEDLVA